LSAILAAQAALEMRTTTLGAEPSPSAIRRPPGSATSSAPSRNAFLRKPSSRISATT